MKTIGRDELKQKIDAAEDFILIDVLPPEQYRKFHLPGALNLPLEEGFEDEIQKIIPDKEQMVVVYCANEQCQASPTAAKMMEELGYSNVYDYEQGKQDWKDAGLPIEK